MTLAGVFAGIDTPSRAAATVTAGLVIEAAVIWRFGWSAPLTAYSGLAVIGAVVSATDLAARRIPNPVVLSAYPITAVLIVLASAPSGLWWPLARAGIATAGLAAFYLALGLDIPRPSPVKRLSCLAPPRQRPRRRGSGSRGSRGGGRPGGWRVLGEPGGGCHRRLDGVGRGPERRGTW